MNKHEGSPDFTIRETPIKKEPAILEYDSIQFADITPRPPPQTGSLGSCRQEN
jgi:hypothetical protein